MSRRREAVLNDTRGRTVVGPMLLLSTAVVGAAAMTGYVNAALHDLVAALALGGIYLLVTIVTVVRGRVRT